MTDCTEQNEDIHAQERHWPIRKFVDEHDQVHSSHETPVMDGYNSNFAYDHCGHEGELVLRPGGRVVRPALMSAVMDEINASLSQCVKRANDPATSASHTVLPMVSGSFSSWAASYGLPPTLAGALFEVRQHVR